MWHLCCCQRLQQVTTHAMVFSQLKPQLHYSNTLRPHKSQKLTVAFLSLCKSRDEVLLYRGMPSCFSAYKRSKPLAWVKFCVLAFEFSGKDGNDVAKTSVVDEASSFSENEKRKLGSLAAAKIWTLCKWDLRCQFIWQTPSCTPVGFCPRKTISHAKHAMFMSSELYLNRGRWWGI